jgi:formylglycine-generating enzyme required for sulfatase activity
MATYGIYQVLDPLYVTPTGSVCSGKIVGGEAAGRIAVKVFSARPKDPDEPDWEPKYFLDRAQVQRRVAAAGGAHWAPVYALGFTPEGGAYYVTDYHALTVQKLIDGRTPIDATALHAIVHCVMAGLGEIRRIAGRAHANLKPSNVLLVGKGPADEMRAVLCDPGAEYKAEKEGDAGDLHALGSLIHELVLHRPPVPGVSPMSLDEPLWNQRLNGKGDAWRQLCADLLAHPIASRAATLDAAGRVVATLGPARLKVPHIRLPGRAKPQATAVAGPAGAAAVAAAIVGIPPEQVPQRVARVRKPRGPSKLKRRLVQLVALAVLAGGTAGVLSVIEGNAREQVCKARGGWYGSLAAGLSDPQRLERFAADPHLKRLTDDVADVERTNVQCRSPRPAVLRFIDVMKSRNAVAALRRVEQDLAADAWPQLAALRTLGETFGKRGWQQPATFVGQLLDGVRPVPAIPASMSQPASTASVTPDAPVPGNLALRIERVLRLRPIIEQQSADADEDWKQLESRTAALEASSDPVVRSFGEGLRRSAASAIRLTDDGFDGLNQLKQNVALAGRVQDAVRTNPPADIDATRFLDAVVRQINTADVGPADVERWLAERPQYVIRRDQIAQAAEALQKAYDKTANDVARSGPEESEAPAFEQELKDVEMAVKDVRSATYVERDIAEGKLKAKVDRVHDQINGLKKYYHAENAADWLKNLGPPGVQSEALKTRWAAWVANLRRDLDSMTTNRQVFARNKACTDKLRDVLQQLELDLPVPPDGLTPEFAAAAVERRDERLSAIVDKLSLSEPAVPPKDLQQSQDALTKWYASLKRLNQDFPLHQKLLTLGDRPDIPWRKDEAFWNDRIVQRLIHADVQRIDSLQKLTTLGRADLVKRATAPGMPDELVVAAWQQLGDKRISPSWPHDVEELQAELKLRGRAAMVAAGLDPNVEATASLRKTLEDTLTREGTRRWRQFVEAADSPEMLGAAIGAQRQFGVDAPTIGGMKPEARFNHSLYLANQAIRDNDASEAATGSLRNVINNLRVAADELDAAKASRVRDKLSKLELPEAFADRTMGDTFRLPVKGIDRPIEFRKIEPKDPSGPVRPFYIGMREITLAEFAGAMDGGNLWAEVRKLAWPAVPEKGDSRLGPRVWEWTGPAGAPRLAAPQLWLAPDDRNNFPTELRGAGGRFNRNVIDSKFGGMPSDRHPMQYVSAQAALFYAASLGCRLPTSAEWHAALDATGQTPANGKWNLRDQTWEVFRQHARQQTPPIANAQWPDQGAFPAEPESLNAPRAGSRKDNDGVLLLRPVPEVGDGVIRDLVGNVAEFTCEVPEALLRWRARGPTFTAEDVRNFFRDTAPPSDGVTVVEVVGGSALSDPKIPYDKPLKVTRSDRGFSDVGIRLAFTAPAHSLAERLKWALAGEDYIWPRTQSADSRGGER